MTTTTMGNDNDDWEVAVDTGEFDKRLEQQEKARAANQEPVISPVSTAGNDDDDSWNAASVNLMKSNKPIRILKRPTSQSQLPTNTDGTKSLLTTANLTAFNDTTTLSNSNLPSSINPSSSTTVPIVSIIPRVQNPNASQSVSTTSSSQASKPAIKTYEQREQEYKLARLRIMGEEESSTKDDDDDNLPPTDSTFVPTDDSNKSSASKATNKIHPPLQCHSTPGSYASNLYALNNVPSNTGTIHFTPNNTNNNSTPNLGTGLFSSPNMPQNYRGAYPVPYSHLSPPRYPYTPTTAVNTNYMTSTAPPPPSSSYHYPPPQHANMSTNNWYNYQHSQTPSGAQQFGHPQ